MSRASRRAAIAGILVLCTGCSAVLGFHDGTLDATLDGGLDASSCDAACDVEASVPASTVITSFTGEPGGIVAANEYVYFAHDGAVYGCPAAQPCGSETIMFSQSVNPRPRSIAAFGGRTAFADPVAGKVSFCFFGMLNRCNSALTFDEPGIKVLASDPTSGNLFFVNTGAGTGKESELRVHRETGSAPMATVATLPSTSPLVSVVTDGPERQFVQLGRMVYSIVTPVGVDAGPSVVHALVPDDPSLPPPAAAAVLVSGRRAIWTRPADAGGGLAQCAILEGETACDAGSMRPFAGAGAEITAAVSTPDTVVWAQRSEDATDLFFCKPTPFDFSEGACTPSALVTRIAGRVSALAIEPTPIGPDNPPKRVFYLATDPSSGNVVLSRTQLP